MKITVKCKQCNSNIQDVSVNAHNILEQGDYIINNSIGDDGFNGIFCNRRCYIRYIKAQQE